MRRRLWPSLCEILGASVTKIGVPTRPSFPRTGFGRARGDHSGRSGLRSSVAANGPRSRPLLHAGGGAIALDGVPDVVERAELIPHDLRRPAQSVEDESLPWRRTCLP